MDIIPVIDIRHGAAVRAVAGRRADYRPLVTPLAATSAPLDVAEGLMSLAAFRTLYIADLDAIEGRGDNRAAVRAIAARFPDLGLWVDAGFRRADDARDWLAIERVEAVFGSESLESLAVLETLPARAILSLDFRGDMLLGPEGLLRASALWPPRVIAMTLDRVGAGAGPDIDRLAKLRAVAGDRALIAAGGVRGLEDLAVLREAGAAAVLVASALHEGRVGSPSSDPR
jgi:phosphoribosylformimino-5-aminoimidazole carboxamide ribotide isomerase